MKRTGQPKILTLAVLTTITVLTWVAFEVFRSFTSHAPTLIDAQTLRPLDPSLDTSVISKLKGELYLPDSDARHGKNQSALVATPVPEASPEASPTSTASPITSPSATASPGGVSQ